MHSSIVIYLAQLSTAQLDTAEKLVTLLRDGGPWALLAIALTAIAWLASRYIQARDDRDAAVSGLNDKLTGLLKDMVMSVEQQKAANEKVADLLDRIERRLENVPQK